ncbi:MAG: hypothetical protein AB1861_19510 [Cyanobacteriota bacterium]
MRLTLITHPETGETLCKKDWANKLGYNYRHFHNRLNKLPLIEALTPKPSLSLGRQWSQEEDDYLCSVYRVPNLPKKWNRTAWTRGWSQRSHYAINSRVALLRRQGFLNNRRFTDESEGWVTVHHLAGCMSISHDVARHWISEGGLKATRNGECKNSPSKIYLPDFIAWACSPIGSAMAAKAVQGDAIASTWLLTQIGIWGAEVFSKKLQVSTLTKVA